MESKSMSVAEVLLRELYKVGVEYVFLVPGAQIVPFVFSLFEHQTGIPEPIIANHELAAGFMAMGYARASGKVGVAFSIGGPGAAYMVGAGVTSRADDAPVLFITGNIPPENFGGGEFQDASPEGTNDSAIFAEAIGNSIVCNKPEDLDAVIEKIHQCYIDFKPLHIQIPFNIQRAEYTQNKDLTINNYKFPSPLEVIKFPDKVKTVLLIGKRALDTIDHARLKAFLERNKVAVVTDMKTRGIVSESEDYSLGYVGFNSDIRALEVFSTESPLAAENIIVTGVKDSLIRQYIKADKVGLVSMDPVTFDHWAENYMSDQQIIHERNRWLFNVNEIKPPKPVPIELENKVSYFDLLKTINHVVPDNVVYCLDSGQIRRAGSIFLTCHLPRTLIQSETLSPMGSGICASIGAQVATKNKRVISLFGDGSMRMHGMELATAVRYNLPIIFILCDNQSYASVKAQDEAKRLPDINWGSYAKLIGIRSIFADNQKDFEKALREAMSFEAPALIWTMVPYLLDDELKKTQALEYKNWLSGI